MTDKAKNSFFVVLLFYTLPIALSIVGGSLLGLSLSSVQFMALSVVAISFGSIALYFQLKMTPVQEDLPPLVPEEDVIIEDTVLEDLKKEILDQKDDIQKLIHERDSEKSSKERLQEEFFLREKLLEEKLEEEQIKTLKSSENLSNMAVLLDRKQEEIDKLGGKIHDLTFEIKTLVQIADLVEEKENTPKPPIIFKSEPPFFEHSEDAKKQLRRCLDIAQKITGSYHIGGYQSRYREMALDNYALDLRRLCDSLRTEKGAAIVVYSPKESKLLFINNHVKTLLGHSPEKFVQDFESIVQEGLDEWKKVISQLALISEAKTSLIIKNKQNEDIVLQCLLGVIPTGVFKHHVLGVLYP